LSLALSILITACSGPSAPEQPSAVIGTSAPSTGLATVRSPDGVDIAATVHSLGRPTLSLVHGWMCDQTYWRAQIPALAERFGVVTVDLAGHGLSGTDRQTWTLNFLAQDTAAVITHLGLDDVIVIGHSMGGRVGLEVARGLPGIVFDVVGVDTLHDADETSNPEVLDLLGSLEKDFTKNCDGFVRSMFGEGTDGALIDHIASDMCSGPGEIGTALLRGYVAFDLAAAMRSAGVPIRCVNADKWPTNVEANREYADFDAVILPKVGHFLMQEAPDELNSALVEIVASPSE
jgi:pimeloyl-ACP methyl ester carboxylesterase